MYFVFKIKNKTFCILFNIKIYSYLTKLLESKSSLSKINIHISKHFVEFISTRW